VPLVSTFAPSVCMCVCHYQSIFCMQALGAKILSSATTVEEARWLEARGADVVIAQV
jgi:NAD(P)H-dependent flavin oxidoreductase YrpB (nitropropane dioxygenase family)